MCACDVIACASAVHVRREKAREAECCMCCCVCVLCSVLSGLSFEFLRWIACLVKYLPVWVSEDYLTERFY